jgi:hypothetical protein
MEGSGIVTSQYCIKIAFGRVIPELISSHYQRVMYGKSYGDDEGHIARIDLLRVIPTAFWRTLADVFRTPDTYKYAEVLDLVADGCFKDEAVLTFHEDGMTVEAAIEAARMVQS